MGELVPEQGFGIPGTVVGVVPGVGTQGGE